MAKLNQRATGINRTILKNPETGETEVLYESRRTALQFWLNVAVQVIVLVGAVFGAVKIGVKDASREVIKTELESGGIIHLQMQECVEEHIIPLKTQLNDLENQIIINTTVIGNLNGNIQDLKRDIRDQNGS